MAYLNQSMIIGNLGRDPELKETKAGPVCNFSVATTKKWSKDGEKQEQTTWHNITAFGKTAELANSFLKKGSMAYISGETRVDSWEDNETGVKKYKTYIVADKIQFLTGRNAEASDSKTEPTSGSTAKKPHNHAPGAINEDEEIPF